MPVKVLLIEDEDSHAEAFIALTARMQFQITRGRTVADCRREVGLCRFSVIILDLCLPDSKGLDVVRQVVECAEGVPVVVYADASTRVYLDTALALGAAACLEKTERDERLVDLTFKLALERGARNEAMAQAAKERETRDQFETLLVALSEQLLAARRTIEESIIGIKEMQPAANGGEGAASSPE